MRTSVWILGCMALAAGVVGASPVEVDLRLKAENLAVDPIDFGDPGMIGDRLRVDVEGPSLRQLTGEARFRNALGQETLLKIDSSFIGADHKIELSDHSFCPSRPVIAIYLDSGGQGVPRVFIQLACDEASSTAVFTPATEPGAELDKISLDISER